MNTIKNLTAFILGIIALFLFYYYVSIPIIPCLSVYITALLFIKKKKKGEKLRKITTIVVAVFGGLLFSQFLTLYITPLFSLTMEKFSVKATAYIKISN